MHPMSNPGGTLTQNGLFYEAVIRHRDQGFLTELVKAYEKIHSGIWAYNGLFELVDALQETSGARRVFKFKLRAVADARDQDEGDRVLDHSRLIPASVKLEVWKRDKGGCVLCGSRENLHFDHIIPYSRGGSSLVAENVQLLCAKHNLAKRDRIE